MTKLTLPGAPILFNRACSTGSHENSFGVGSISISAARDGRWVWLDIGEIYFASPTEEQMMDAETAPWLTEAGQAKSDIHRRLSRKQAELFQEIFLKVIDTLFEGQIPADDEIEEWKKANL